MIRKPPAGFQRGESAAVKTVQTAIAAAKSGAGVARRGGDVGRGLFCFFFAAIWGLAALGGLAAGSLPTFIGVGAMSALMAWAGRRAFAKARAPSA